MKTDNFKFRITQFSESWMLFIMILNDQKYPGTFDSVFDGLTPFARFLKTVSLNQKSEFGNGAPNREFLMKYRPISETAGHILLKDVDYPYQEKIYLNGLVSRKYFVRECYTEVLKLYNSEKFNAYQNFVKTTEEGS